MGLAQACPNHLYSPLPYLEDTDTLNRAKALKEADLRGKTPAKLTISIKLIVLDKENPRFKAEWTTT